MHNKTRTIVNVEYYLSEYTLHVTCQCRILPFRIHFACRVTYSYEGPETTFSHSVLNIHTVSNASSLEAYAVTTVVGSCCVHYSHNFT